MILLVFVDGVGLGERGARNPLDGCGSPYFEHFRDEPLAVPRGGAGAVTDTTLGVEGLPQSATGQATIITGENAPAFLGRHQSGFPGGSLRPLLRDHSLFRKLGETGLRVAHANVVTSRVARRRTRFMSATAVAAEEAGLEPRSLADVATGRALHHDFTGELLRSHGVSHPNIVPSDAGRRLARLASEYDFCVFEYFLTDAAGHARDFSAARAHVERLTEFLDATLDATDLARDTVLMTSDHGNLEDLSTGSHTLNPVATLAWGADAFRIVEPVRALTDIAPSIEEAVRGR